MVVGLVLLVLAVVEGTYWCVLRQLVAFDDPVVSEEDVTGFF